MVIPSFNEEVNLPDCLASVSGWAEDVWVVDSCSAGRTVEIALRRVPTSLVDGVLIGAGESIRILYQKPKSTRILDY